MHDACVADKQEPAKTGESAGQRIERLGPEIKAALKMAGLPSSGQARLIDGKSGIPFEHPVTVAEVAASIGAGLAKAALAGKVDGKLVDTSFRIDHELIVDDLAKTLARELAPDIRVNSLMPGRFNTDRIRSLDQTRADALGVSPEDVAARADRVIERVLGAGGVGAEVLELGDERLLVGRAQAVAATARVLVQRLAQ